MAPLTGASVQWGNVGTWVAGIATSFAFFVTASVFAMQLYDRRRQDARRVAAWITNRGPSDRSSRRVVVVMFRNGSPEPVYNVLVVAQARGRVLPSGGLSLRNATAAALATRGPDATELVRFELESVDDDPPIHLLFADAAGRRWHRHPNGRLRRVAGRDGDDPRRGSPID